MPPLRLLAFALALLVTAGCGWTSVFQPAAQLSPQAEDERIVAEISTHFLKSEAITYLDMLPYSYGGHVYLVGEADSPEEIDAAVDIAKSVQGVRSVTTYVLPKPEQPACSALDNARIERGVQAAILAGEGASVPEVDLTVFQCMVVLTGRVEDKAVEDRLLAEARAVDGVRAAKSLLRVAK